MSLFFCAALVRVQVLALAYRGLDQIWMDKMHS
jgi:hypothetical protein